MLTLAVIPSVYLIWCTWQVKRAPRPLPVEDLDRVAEDCCRHLAPAPQAALRSSPGRGLPQPALPSVTHTTEYRCEATVGQRKLVQLIGAKQGAAVR